MRFGHFAVPIIVSTSTLLGIGCSTGSRATRPPSPSPSPTFLADLTLVPPTLTPAPGAVNGAASMSFADEKHGWLALGGKVLATSDGGATWRPRGKIDSLDAGLQFVDDEHGWASGDGNVFRTIDGGASWSRIAAPSPASFVNFISDSGGRIVVSKASTEL